MPHSSSVPPHNPHAGEMIAEVMKDVEWAGYADLQRAIIFGGETDDSADFEHEKGEFDPGLTDEERHEEAVLEGIEKQVENADISKSKKRKLREVLLKYKEAFALNQEFCSMSKLTPVKCELKEGHPDINQKARFMNDKKLAWLKEKIDDLVKRISWYAQFLSAHARVLNV